MPLFLATTNTCFRKGCLPQSLCLASITLLFKKDKDPLHCASYRPISVINADYKIIAKALALRLERVLPSIIHLDQTGFVQGRTSTDNLRRYFDILYHTNESNSENVILSVDAEKAFDRVEWKYLMSGLRRFNFGPKFCHWILILYSSPMAVVKTNSNYSKSFLLSRGTRQGCLMSPALFATTIEPLAAMIRSHDHIKGITIGREEHIISLYADDILLYLHDPLNSMPSLLSLFEEFGKLSGYKVNWDKTEIMPISNFDHILLMNHLNWKWSTKCIKYLGMLIPRNPEDTFNLNYLPLVNKISEELKRIGHLPISLVGRVNIVKMSVLPTFLYLFQNLPTIPPQSFFKKVQSLISSFIWNNKTPQICMSVLHLPYESGGLKLPNLYYYFLSSQLTQFKQWFLNTSCSWKIIESFDIYPYSLKNVPYIGFKEVGKFTKNPVILNC